MAKTKGITNQQAKRISTVVRKNENYFQFPAPQARVSPALSSMRTVPVVGPPAGMAPGSRSAPTSGMGSFLIPGTGDALIPGDPVKLWNYKAVSMGSGGKTGDAYWWGGKWIMGSWEC
jgi:hypothetical protein